MSLRLDPKYHGVRVARVRPKDSALTNERVYNRYNSVKADLLVPGKGHLTFKRSVNNPQWVPSVYCGHIGAGLRTLYTDIYDVLEALGLR